MIGIDEHDTSALEGSGKRNVHEVTLDRTGRDPLSVTSASGWGAAGDAGDESILVVDAEGIIVHANQAACRGLGYAVEELVGRHARILRSPHTPREVHQAMRAWLSAGRTWRGLLFTRRKDGPDDGEFVSITPLHGRGGDAVLGYVAVRHGTTGPHAIGEELEAYRSKLEGLVEQRTAEIDRARSAAEAASAAKSAFLASMSHEIRTPMNGVIGIVDVLLQSSLTPYQKELADTIAESAGALLRVIDGILDFSKIEAGRMDLEDEPFDLVHLIESAADTLQSLAAARGVDLRLFVAPDLPAQRRGDALRVRQIINNLVGNAIKFSSGLDRGGAVRLSVHPNGHGVRIGVSDNGIGMSPETLNRLFQPFTQAEHSTTRTYGGTGLGLVITQRLAQAMGGTVRVRSGPGEGSRFDVELPLPVVDTPTTWPERPPLVGVTCHLWLDDERLSKDWQSYLAAAGARVRVRRPSQEPSARLEIEGDTDVLVCRTDHLPSDWAAAQGARDQPPCPTVCVQHGQRRSPRKLAAGLVSIDVDGLRRDALVHSVAMALGRTDHEAAASSLPGQDEAWPDIDQAAASGRLVLVAEDNDVNRKVIRHQLRLLGVAAEIVGDGQEALDRWRASPRRYALLLTDLHMPCLDGYELARAIRDLEAHERSRLPIVALTANALRGEADRCQNAGMDDYLGKPVSLESLKRSLRRWLVTARVSDPAAVPDTPASGFVGFDDSALARLVGGDESVIDTLRHDYLEGADHAQRQLDAAAAVGDWSALAQIAHRVKSSSRAVGALALGQLLDDLERAARQGNAALVPELLRSVRSGLTSVKKHLRPTMHNTTMHSGQPVGGSSSRIMLVDDEPFHHRVIERQLLRLGASGVEFFESGAAALARLDGTDTSTVLTLVDLDMPTMDGVELIRRLALSGYRGAVALSSGADTRLLETAHRLALAWGLRTVGHLHKPSSIEALRDLLDQWRSGAAVQAQRSRLRFDAVAVRQALQARQLVVHYQPQVDMATRHLVGVEALARWQHPKHGLLGPDCFVPVAETHGLVDELTEQVLAQSLMQSAAWAADLGEPVRVAVNVSMDNLSRLDFPDRVVGHLQANGLSPSALVLEVTETRLMKDQRAPLDVLARLRLRGVGLSVDDFGTGHSSLAQLRDLPFDELKVDRGFVHGGRDHGTLRAILTGSTEMARHLGMHVVAEGVEDQADWDFAKQTGCHVAQGWFVARPMAAQALPGWLREWRGRALV